MQKHRNSNITEVHMASALSSSALDIINSFLVIYFFQPLSPDRWVICLCLHACVFMFAYVLCRVNKAQSQPRQKRMPVSRPSFDCSEPEDSNGGWNPSAAPPLYSSAGELTLFI